MSRAELRVALLASAAMLFAFALPGCGGAAKSTGTFEAIRASAPGAPPAKPSVTAGTPPATEDKPSAPADKPSATADKPSVPASKPSATADKRSAPADKPLATGDKPAAPASKPSVPASDQARLADQMTRIAGELNDLQNAVAKLIASSRQQDDQLTYLRRRVDELESQNRGRLPAAPSGFAPAAPMPPPAAAAPPPTVSATATTAADLYRSGTEKLRAKQLDAAILTFYDLITTYPDHPLRESAQFLVADILYTQKDYRGALGEFEALVSALPRGEKVPDALVKIGLCERDLGDVERAKRTWERVVGDYPSTTAARQARILLRN